MILVPGKTSEFDSVSEAPTRRMQTPAVHEASQSIVISPAKLFHAFYRFSSTNDANSYIFHCYILLNLLVMTRG